MSHDPRHEEVPRSEGDLRIYWDEQDGRITEAWCQGTMYRGYEMILVGRPPDDAIATTARLCGICSTSHVVAATHALEDAWNITPPAQAIRLRNLFLAAESVMSDARQGACSSAPGCATSPRSPAPALREIIRPTSHLSRLATTAGDGPPPSASWASSPPSPNNGRIPYRSAPGGATCPVGLDEIRRARAAVDDYPSWYAPTVLGGTLDEWAQARHGRRVGRVAGSASAQCHWSFSRGSSWRRSVCTRWAQAVRTS